MIQESARNILRTAENLANATNSAVLDFDLAVSLLNIEYRKLYDEIITTSTDFSKSFKAHAGINPLPSDCYLITAVFDGNIPLERSGIQNKIGYRVENGCLIVDRDVEVVYSTLPSTITLPEKAIEIDGPIELQEHTNYFVQEKDGGYIYTSHPYSYLNKPLTWDSTSVQWGDEDVSDIVCREGTTIKNIQVHSPYMMVSYSDGVIFIFTGWKKAVWNYNCIYGHETLGEIVALKTNDVTGKGAVWKDEYGTYWYVSFVPDTILNYPSSTFFTLLTYRLAIAIAGLLGMDVTDLTERVLPEAEVAFYKTLSYGTTATRINNKNPSQLRRMV